MTDVGGGWPGAVLLMLILLAAVATVALGPDVDRDDREQAADCHAEAYETGREAYAEAVRNGSSESEARERAREAFSTADCWSVARNTSRTPGPTAGWSA